MGKQTDFWVGEELTTIPPKRLMGRNERLQFGMLFAGDVVQYFNDPVSVGILHKFKAGKITSR
jgi:hypothetical protein